jgi:hypothetical protein
MPLQRPTLVESALSVNAIVVRLLRCRRKGGRDSRASTHFVTHQICYGLVAHGIGRVEKYYAQTECNIGRSGITL